MDKGMIEPAPAGSDDISAVVSLVRMAMKGPSAWVGGPGWDRGYGDACRAANKRAEQAAREWLKSVIREALAEEREVRR